MRARSICLAVVAAALAIAAPVAHADTFVVDSLANGGDWNLAIANCDSDPDPGVTACTLRAAIQQANATSAGAPHKIHFSLGAGATIAVPADLDAVSRQGTEIDGCSAVTQTSPCVGLRSPGGAGTGLEVDAIGVTVRGLAISNFETGILTGAGAAGLIVRNSDLGVRVDHTTVEGMGTGVLVQADGARIGGDQPADRNVFAGNGTGLSILGGDSAGVFGNRFGVLRSGTVAGNGRGIELTGLPLSTDTATGTVIGDDSFAADDDGFCSGACNVIAGSSSDIGDGNGAGIDLSGNEPIQLPAADATIAGNWIGLDPSGEAAGNDIGIKVGNAGVGAGVMIGGPTSPEGNLIAGNNGPGVEQDGDGVISVLLNVFGESPERLAPMPNTGTNALLGGDVGAHDALVIANHFGATTAGLVLTGPQPCVSGNFFTPFVGSYSQAAIVVEPGATSARIGNTVPCAGFSRSNAFGSVAAGAPAVLVRGADDVRVIANFFGAIPYAAPLAGPSVRIEDGPGANPASGAQIGSDDSNLWNAMMRTGGPAIQIADHAAGIVVAGNEGIVTGDFASPLALFTDLLPGAGAGNNGAANGNIQPPAIGVATEAGISGTGTPGAVIRVLQQWRADDPVLGIDGPGEGYTLPTSPGTTPVAADGTWSMAFAAKLPPGQKLTASQTTAAGSSEYAAIRTAAPAPDLPVAKITAGPSGTVGETSATFSFSTATPGATLECGVDGAEFAPCSSPMTIGPLDQGAHQFRVQARLGSLVSLPASRIWTVQTPAAAPPPGATGPPASSAALRFAKIVTMPSSKRCISRRLLRLRLRKPAGQRIVYAEVRVRGRATRTVSGAKLSAPIDLRGLPKGSVKVRVRVVLSSGRVISGSRTYRTCAAKKPRR